MLILGSCLALNLNYSGCCDRSKSRNCGNNGCYCHQDCYLWKNCCPDIANIGCYNASSSSFMISPTPTDTQVATPGKQAI